MIIWLSVYFATVVHNSVLKIKHDDDERFDVMV